MSQKDRSALKQWVSKYLLLDVQDIKQVDRDAPFYHRDGPISVSKSSARVFDNLCEQVQNGAVFCHLLHALQAGKVDMAQVGITS